MDNDFLNEFKLSKEIKKKLKNKKQLKKDFSEGKTPQEIVGYSDETMAKFYKAAYHLFENRHYRDAADAFLFLVTLNAYNHDYWLGVGMSSQMLGDFDLAVDAYEMAAICSMENPIPYFYLAKCLFAMHDRSSAIQALDLAIEYSAELPEYADLKNQALAALKLLKHHG
jgi:type III secretion system low calcium response chaperone LcrH/SycD